MARIRLGYKNWRELAIPMLRNSIAAARKTGARLIFPGNVYNFGPDAGAFVNEASPQHPLTRKGAVRVEMEQMLLAASTDAGVRALIIRAGDFFGPHQPASWFRDAMVKPGKPLKSVVYPGEPNAGHAWAYLPDLAEVVALLADREASLPDFDSFHFGGYWFERGVEFAEAVQRASQKPDLPVRRFPWIFIYLGSPFVTVFREALEMRYLWREPLRLDNAKLGALIGEEPHTAIDKALRTTLAGLGCIQNAG
jgi:nucleoside-diphosphate-sugar epimerase